MADKSYDVVLTFQSNTTELSKSISQAQQQIFLFSKSLEGIKDIASKLTSTFTESISAYRGLQTEIANVSTLFNSDIGTLHNLEKGVLSLASTLPMSAESLSKAMYEAVSAGIDVGNSLKFVEVSSKIAIAGMTDTRTSVDVLTTVLNSYKMSSKEAMRVSDILFQTVKLGKTTFEQLAPTMSSVTPIASVLGVSIEEVSAAIATLTKQGTPTAEATTQIARAMTAFIEKTTEGEELAKKFGLNLSASAFETKSFQQVLNEMYAAVGGNIEEFKKFFPSIQGFQAALKLVGSNAKGAKEDLEAMYRATGATEEATTKMIGTIDAKMSIFKNNIDAYKQGIGSALAPMVEIGIDVGVKFLNVLNAIPNPIKLLIALMTSLTTAFISIKLVALDKVFLSIINILRTSFIPVVQMATTKILAFNVALGGIPLLVTAAVASLGALTYAGIKAAEIAQKEGEYRNQQLSYQTKAYAGLGKKLQEYSNLEIEEIKKKSNAYNDLKDIVLGYSMLIIKATEAGRSEEQINRLKEEKKAWEEKLEMVKTIQKEIVEGNNKIEDSMYSFVGFTEGIRKAEESIFKILGDLSKQRYHKEAENLLSFIISSRGELEELYTALATLDQLLISGEISYIEYINQEMILKSRIKTLEEETSKVTFESAELEAMYNKGKKKMLSEINEEAERFIIQQRNISNLAREGAGVFSEFGKLVSQTLQTKDWEGFKMNLKELIKQTAISVLQALIPVQVGYFTANILAGNIAGATANAAVLALIGTAIGSIQAFATGGHPSKPTLAMVAEKEPEWIIPDSKLPEFINQFSPNINIVVKSSDPNTFVEYIDTMPYTIKERLRNSFV